MTWYALEALDEAVEEAKDLLFPFDKWTWAKLALLVLFTSGGMNFPSSLPSPDSSTDGTRYGGYDDPSPYGPGILDSADLPVTGMATAVEELPPSAYGIAVILLVLLLGVMAVAAIFEFVYYRSLLDKEVVIRRNFMEQLESGLRLFGFRVAVLSTGIVLAAFVLLNLGQIGSETLTMVVLAALPAFIVFRVFLLLTNKFIPLVMMDHDVALIPAWQLFYETLREEWKQVGLYVLGMFVLGIAVGIFVLLAVMLMLIPILLVAVVFIFLVELPMLVLALLAGAGAVLGLAVILYFILVPVRTYLRYYTILVYQKLDV